LLCQRSSEELIWYFNFHSEINVFDKLYLAQPEKNLNEDDEEFNFDSKDEIQCCSSDGQFLPQDLRHPECFPISIPANDPFHGAKGRR